jgi:glycosyltransferase involved in cell wall biosynthesis
MSIKTLHITNAYHACSGGIRTFYRALLEAANRHQRLVRVVVPSDEDFVEEVGEFGRIYHVTAPRSPVLDSRYRLMLPHMYALPCESRLRSILADERPDLVEVCDKFLLCYLSGVLRRGWIPELPVPAILGLSCERLDDTLAAFVSANPATQTLAKFYMRRFYTPRFDFHLAVSEYVAEELCRAGAGDIPGALYIAPMGVDFEWFNRHQDPTPLRDCISTALAAPRDAVFLLYAGRLSKEKNLSLLPEMLAHLARISARDFRLVVAGSGPLEKELRSRLEQSAPGRSLFLGHQERESLAALFRAVDLFVHPNPREPFGIVPLEAMSAGLPVLVPRSGGVLTYANDGNAWLANADGACFAAAALEAMNRPAERACRTASAQRTAARFSWVQGTARYFQLYDTLQRRLARQHLYRSADVWRQGFGPRAA